MGYIGNEAQTAFTSFDKQTITGTGTAVYTLSHSVANEQEIEVFVNNVRQEGGSGKAFTVSGNQITFTENIASTDTVYVNFAGKAVQTVSHPSDQPMQATTGTFSGAVSGTTGTFSSNVDVGGSLLVDSIKEGTGTNTAMTIDSDGYVTMPNKPSFNATDGNTANPTVWSNTVHNIGNHFDGTYFTAPVAGTYFFALTCGSHNNFGMDIFLNGSVIRRVENLSPGGFSWDTTSLIVRLAEGDEVSTGTFTGAPATNAPYGGFSGHLVG